MRARAAALLVLSVAACARWGQGPRKVSASDAPPPITGTTWLWGETVDPERTWVPDVPERYTLFLAPGGAAQMVADCNRGRATYALDGGRLELGPLATTRLACPPGSLDDRYLKQLAGVRHLAVVAGMLRADLVADSGTMWFVAEEDAIHASYLCAGGRGAWAVYTPGRARVVAGPDALDLPQLPSGSGARYGEGDVAWSTKGEEAFLERGGARVLDGCRAAGGAR